MNNQKHCKNLKCENFNGIIIIKIPIPLKERSQKQFLNFPTIFLITYISIYKCMLFSFFFRYYSKRKIIILFPKFINNKKNSPNIFPNLNHLLIPPNRIIPNYSFVPIKTNKFPCVHTHTHTRVSTNIVTRHVSFTFNLSNKTKSITHAKNTTRMSPEHFHLYYLIVALPACYYLSPPFT